MHYAKHRDNVSNKIHSGKRWTVEEEKLLLTTDRPTDSVLARQLGRSMQALQVKRSKLLAKLSVL
jgi:hypothetical protein